jgi:uncharacterized membrane protein YdjX (TVP38/TMEM64 family)
MDVLERCLAGRKMANLSFSVKAGNKSAAPDERDHMPDTAKLKRFLPLLIIALALTAFFASGLYKKVSLDTLQQQHQALRDFANTHALLAPLMMALLYAALVAISFPGAGILTIVCGFMFGAIKGTGVVVCGATLGGVLVFLAARTAFGEVLRARAGPFLSKLQAGFERNAASYMMVLRLTPIFPFWLVNIAAPVFGVPLRTFAATTFFGIIPGTFVYASIGAGAGALLADGKSLSLQGVLFKPAVLIPISGLILLSLMPIALRKLKVMQ